MFAKAKPLGERVEVKVMGELAKLRDVRFIVGWRVGDDMLAEMLSCQSRLPQPGSAATIKIVAQIGESFPTGKTLESQHHVATCGFFHLAKNGAVAFQGGDGDNEHGGMGTQDPNALRVERIFR